MPGFASGGDVPLDGKSAGGWLTDLLDPEKRAQMDEWQRTHNRGPYDSQPKNWRQAAGEHIAEQRRYADEREKANEAALDARLRGGGGAESYMKRGQQLAQAQMRQGHGEAARMMAAQSVSRGASPLAARAAIYGGGQQALQATNMASQTQAAMAAQAAQLRQQHEHAQMQGLLGTEQLALDERKRRDIRYMDSKARAMQRDTFAGQMGMSLGGATAGAAGSLVSSWTGGGNESDMRSKTDVVPLGGQRFADEAKWRHNNLRIKADRIQGDLRKGREHLEKPWWKNDPSPFDDARRGREAGAEAAARGRDRRIDEEVGYEEPERRSSGPRWWESLLGLGDDFNRRVESSRRVESDNQSKKLMGIIRELKSENDAMRGTMDRQGPVRPGVPLPDDRMDNDYLGDERANYLRMLDDSMVEAEPIAFRYNEEDAKRIGQPTNLRAGNSAQQKLAGNALTRQSVRIDPKSGRLGLDLPSETSLQAAQIGRLAERLEKVERDRGQGEMGEYGGPMGAPAASYRPSNMGVLRQFESREQEPPRTWESLLEPTEGRWVESDEKSKKDIRKMVWETIGDFMNPIPGGEVSAGQKRMVGPRTADAIRGHTQPERLQSDLAARGALSAPTLYADGSEYHPSRHKVRTGTTTVQRVESDERSKQEIQRLRAENSLLRSGDPDSRRVREHGLGPSGWYDGGGESTGPQRSIGREVPPPPVGDAGLSPRYMAKRSTRYGEPPTYATKRPKAHGRTLAPGEGAIAEWDNPELPERDARSRAQLAREDAMRRFDDMMRALPNG